MTCKSPILLACSGWRIRDYFTYFTYVAPWCRCWKTMTQSAKVYEPVSSAFFRKWWSATASPSITKPHSPSPLKSTVAIRKFDSSLMFLLCLLMMSPPPGGEWSQPTANIYQSGFSDIGIPFFRIFNPSHCNCDPHQSLAHSSHACTLVFG